MINTSTQVRKASANRIIFSKELFNEKVEIECVVLTPTNMPRNRVVRNNLFLDFINFPESFLEPLFLACNDYVTFSLLLDHSSKVVTSIECNTSNCMFKDYLYLCTNALSNRFNFDWTEISFFRDSIYAVLRFKRKETLKDELTALMYEQQLLTIKERNGRSTIDSQTTNNEENHS